MNDRTRGLYRKYDVRRTDGSDLPGGKHHHCQYFVLDLDHDPHAKAALKAYIVSCHNEYPCLADDLRELAYDDIRAALAAREERHDDHD